MADDENKYLIAIVLIAASLFWTVWSLRNLAIDLRFYSRNGWDFEADSGVRMGTGYGYGSQNLTAQQRFKYGHLMHVGFGIVFNVMSAVALLSFS